MINYRITPGTTNVSVTIRIIDSTDGTPETGVTSATGGLALEYRRETAVSTAITESDLSLLTDAHSDGGMLHIGNGYYRLDVPDAAFAAGVPGCLIHGAVTGMVVIGCYVHLEDAVDAVYDRIGAPVAASISADIAVVDGVADSILVDTAEIGAAGAGLTAINLPDQTMNITGDITGNLSGSVGSVTGNVGGNVTGSVGSNLELGPAEVNAEVVDALATDTYAEPGQGAPAATATLAAKINYLYKAWRNRSNQTATTYQLFADDATTVDQKATVSDDGTTAEKGEIATGP